MRCAPFVDILVFYFVQAVSELDEILREQTRQEDLWVEHYVNNMVWPKWTGSSEEEG